MKKIVTGIVALALASSVFAADVAAKVYMTGSIASGDKDSTSFLTLDAVDQKDADAIVLTAGGDQAGANFQLWYKYSGGKDVSTDGSAVSNALNIRSTNLWFKPIDMVKVTIGDMSFGGYKEMIHWWKDPTGSSLVQATAWDGRYSSYNTVEAAGFGVEVTPIDGLYINAAVAPGAGASFYNTKNETTAAYGAAVKYDFNGLTGLPITAIASWRDEGAGTAATKIAAIGADYGAAFGDGFYGFVNARMYMRGSNASWAAGNLDDLKLRGIAIDNYFKYSVGALKVAAQVPVIIRTSGEANDPSYMLYDIKATYGIDAYTPYLEICNNDAYTPIAFDGSQPFGIQIQPGVTFNVGSCALDVSVKFNLYDGAFAWSVPFTAGVQF